MGREVLSLEEEEKVWRYAKNVDELNKEQLEEAIKLGRRLIEQHLDMHKLGYMDEYELANDYYYLYLFYRRKGDYLKALEYVEKAYKYDIESMKQLDEDLDPHREYWEKIIKELKKSLKKRTE